MTATTAPGPDAAAAVLALYRGDRAVQAAGIRIADIAPGRVQLELTPGPEMGNGHGIVHGGWLASLADTAFAYAFASRGTPGVTTHIDMAFIRAAQVGQTLTAIAEEYHYDGAAGIYDVAIVDGGGRKVAAMRAHGRIPRTKQA